jgi:hypothetical protein
MSRSLLLLMMLLVASALTELRAGQHRGLLDRLPILTADTPKQCCRVCKKGKACGNGCISQERQCAKAPGCACKGSGSS